MKNKMMKKVSGIVGLGTAFLLISACAAADGSDEPLVVYSAGPGGLAESLAEGFTQETGREVDLFQSTTGSVVGRLEAEMDNPAADVVILASWPSGMDLMERELLHTYADAENADLLNEGWNGDNQLFGYSASALGITYNTELIEQAGEDWADYTDEEFNGLVAMPDPSESGSALDFIAGYLSDQGDSGWALFEELVENDLEVAGANRPALDSVINGANGVVLAGVDYMAYSVMEQGEPIDIHYASSGTVVNPRPAMILDSSERKEAAEQFIDYLLSDGAQEIVADDYLLPGRSDIDAHPDRVPFEDINELDIDWEWMMEEQENINERFQESIR
ncbi:ABC transporter substrate-binding protein [Alkalibacterium sp.]|nr:MAG: extracellular solute-binding protein [Alkalibacterium sp.]